MIFLLIYIIRWWYLIFYIFYNSKYLSFYYSGHTDRTTEWRNNPALFEKIVVAISKCGLKDSLTTLNMFTCAIEASVVQQMLNRNNLAHVTVVMENPGTPLME